MAYHSQGWRFACSISREYYNRIENGKTQLTGSLKRGTKKQIERFNPEEPLFLLIDYFRVRFLLRTH